MGRGVTVSPVPTSCVSLRQFTTTAKLRFQFRTRDNPPVTTNIEGNTSQKPFMLLSGVLSLTPVYSLGDSSVGVKRTGGAQT